MTDTAAGDTAAARPVTAGPRVDPVLRTAALGFPWETADPFLFCAYHDDAYPKADANMGPGAPLTGRNLGQDFSRRDGWSMYHGETVPGFPAHPHRGFETITIVRKGLIDHADSLGAAARFGEGDVQWVTAGQGIVHSEMFPLLDTTGPNPVELFQIWLNLPARDKMAAPHFTMMWAERIARTTATDDKGRTTDVVVIAGTLAGAGEPPAPPPDSWAARPESDLAVWTLRMTPGARWTLPAAGGTGTRRHLYFFRGRSVVVGGRPVDAPRLIELRADLPTDLVNGEEPGEFLLLQGQPIGEPVAQYGPFVMNTQAEIAQALNAYRRTQFGGWPWPDPAPVHGRDPARFARYPDGRTEHASGTAPGAGVDAALA